MAPLLRRIYDQVNASTTTTKTDSSVFTIADGVAQHMLKLLLKDIRFAGMVGEEDAVTVNIEQRPYHVDSIAIPAELWDELDSLRARLAVLQDDLPHADALVDCTCFIDPIDGTREFTEGLGEQCTVCVGISRSGRPVGGLVYRPLTSPTTWALGSLSEGTRESRLLSPGDVHRLIIDRSRGRSKPVPREQRPPPSDAPGMLMSRGVLSDFCLELSQQLGFARLRSGGAGNKALMLLEGVGVCYIQDRGLFRWDTCAAQGVLEAHGGAMGKLTTYIATGQIESYTYVHHDAADDQVDFEPGARLTAYNLRAGQGVEGDRAVRAAQIKPYANICGVCALPSAEDADTFLAAVRRANQVAPADMS